MPRAPSGSPNSDSSAKKRSKPTKADSNDGKNEEGPRRVALACVSCRTRKIKCPAQQPECAICKQDGRVCSYVRVTAAENAAARAKKHNSKLVKAARLAQDPSASPSAELVTSPSSSRGKGRASQSNGSDFGSDTTAPYLRLETSWPLPANSFVAGGSDTLPTSSFPLNLPSLSGQYSNQQYSSYSQSLPHSSTPMGATWNLPTDPNSLTAPSTGEPALLASSAPAAYPLPSFYNFPPQNPAISNTQSTGMFSYSSPSGYPDVPYQSYLSPPLQPYSSHNTADYDAKASAPEMADINNPHSTAYVDQSASPFGASQAGSEADSWSSSHVSSHAHSSTSTSSGPIGTHHLRQSSQTSVSDGCSPFLSGSYLPQSVPIGQHGQPAYGGAAYGGLGLELRTGYAGPPFGAPHSEQSPFGTGW